MVAKLYVRWDAEKVATVTDTVQQAALVLRLSEQAFGLHRGAKLCPFLGKEELE